MERKDTSVVQRNYGVDLLRIVSMFMVVVLHILGGGGILDSTKPLSVNYCCAWLLEIAAYAAVDCYALISGYVGIRAKRKWTNVVMLWLQVAFYSCLFTVIFGNVNADITGIKKIIKSLLPVTFQPYWYFTAYVGMWLFIPILNAAVEVLSKRQMGITLAIAIGVIIPVSILSDAFTVKGGYSVMWLMCLYLVGAFLKKHNILQLLTKKKWLSAYLVCVAVTMLSKVCIVIIRGSTGNVLVNYVSPTIILSAIALLGVFSNLKINEIHIKWIRWISPLVFGVYLIHNHPLVFEITMRDRFKWLAERNFLELIGCVVLIAIAIFAGCIIIEYVRSKIISLLKVKSLIQLFEEKIECLWQRIFLKVETRA